MFEYKIFARMRGWFSSQSGQALLPPLKLCQKGLVPAAPARRACATSTSSSSARQTFPSGLTPAVKDCFELHGHSAFGSVAMQTIVDMYLEGITECLDGI